MDVKLLSQGGQIDYNSTKVQNSDSADQANTNDSVQNKESVENSSTSNKDFNEKEIKSAVDKLNKFLEDNQTHAEYAIHDKFKDIMIKIVDNTTGKIVQEIPPKKLLDTIAKMCEIAGVFIDKKA